MISMFEPRIDSVTFEKKVCTTRCGHQVDDDDLRKETSYSYIVGKHDDRKQEEVNFKTTVEFKFNCEDNLREDIQVQRRRPEWKTNSMEAFLNGRQPQWKTTSMDDNLNGR